MNQPGQAAMFAKPASGLWKSCLLLVLALVGVFPLFAWHGYATHGSWGILAAAVAGGVCLLAALGALLLAGFAGCGPQAVSAVLLGMMLRMGLPMVVGFVLWSRGGPLAEAGVFGYVLVYYLFALLVETLLSVQVTRRIASEASRD